MVPEDYLRQYAELIRPSKVESDLASNGTSLMIERGYYYPPYLQQEACLEVLSRADLLEISEKILHTKYPQQRLIRRQVGDYLEWLRALKEERTWRQLEMERLDGELARCMHGSAILEAERIRLEAQVYEYQAEMDNRQRSFQNRIDQLESMIISLQETITNLYASTSWKVTVPLRFVGGMLRSKLSSFR